MPVTIRARDVKASNLIFASVALYVVQTLLYRPYPNQTGSLWWLLLGATGYLTIKVVLAFGIRAGYGWVRILFVLLTIPTILIGVKDIVTYQEPISKVILPVLSMALQAWAAVIIVKTQLADHD